jgi:hypothetical protein
LLLLAGQRRESTMTEPEVDSTVCLAIDDERRVLPDTLLPAQLTRPSARHPERTLLAALLLDAVECFLEHHEVPTARHRRLFEEAEQWIFGTDGAAAFSFGEVCDFLSVDADCLRTALLRWRAGQPTRPNATVVQRQRYRPFALRSLIGVHAA